MSRNGGPFDLDDRDAFHRWSEWKLAGHPKSPADLVVDVADPENLTDAEAGAVVERVRRSNMALIAGPGDHRFDEGKRLIRALGDRFGLRRLDSNMCADDDGITPLSVSEGGERARYIPYTNHPIRWHSDGYYNAPDHQIRGLILYCLQDSAFGGENGLMDQEVAYILIRNASEDYVRALMHPECMTIPPNEGDGGEEIRAAQAGPVFSVDPATGSLHMRYTMRKRNVIWREDAATREAVAFIENLLEGNSPYIFRHRMTPGQGLICNNVLHDRAGFADDPESGKRRLIFRARYYDRINGTGLGQVWPQGGQPS